MCAYLYLLGILSDDIRLRRCAHVVLWCAIHYYSYFTANRDCAACFRRPLQQSTSTRDTAFSLPAVPAGTAGSMNAEKILVEGILLCSLLCFVLSTVVLT